MEAFGCSVEQCLRIFRLVAKSLAGQGWIDYSIYYPYSYNLQELLADWETSVLAGKRL